MAAVAPPGGSNDDREDHYKDEDKAQRHLMDLHDMEDPRVPADVKAVAYLGVRFKDHISPHSSHFPPI